jgi:hypothetical protein
MKMEVDAMGKIYGKIYNIMSRIKYMPKDGDIQFGKTKYKYLSAEEIIKNVRTEMIKEKLIMYPFETEVTNQTGSEKDLLVTYRVVAVEDNSFIDVQVAGGGYDSADKKTYKAITGAYKYAIRQMFMIETGDDDPDKTPSVKITKPVLNPKINIDEGTVAYDKKEIDNLLDLAFTSDKTRRAFVNGFKGTEAEMVETLKARIGKEIK